MTPERWAVVERLFHAALAVDAPERDAWLREGCGGDASLQREVASLLARAPDAENFLDTPAIEYAAREIAGEPALSRIGQRFGPHTVLSLLGSGATGDVYRANDATLGRDVALKVLPADFAQEAERLTRVTHEAQMLAALNHPNIAAIYGIEESDGVHALVMELVDGEDLSAIIERGAMPLAEALPIAQQIADALESAHERGIIHRDLKPANIKVRGDGTVKVLDFGLAKGHDPAAPAGPHPPRATPASSPLRTRHGLIVGTAAYMAPEHAKGKSVDKRADIWAFGAVLFEMLTGRRAFLADDVAQTLELVTRSAPPFDALPSATPARLRALIERCLERDPRLRLRDIGEARFQLAAIAAEDRDAPAAAPRGRPRRRASALLAAAVCGAVITGASFGIARWLERPHAPPVYASIDLPDDYVLGEGDVQASLPTRTPMAFTTDGRALVIQAARAGKPQLFLRSLDRPDARPIPGTDDARVPFVSPDGGWIGFSARGELRKIPIGGGTATPICPITALLGPNGAAWGAGDVIVFGDEDSGRIMRVAASGGVPAAVTPKPAIRRRHTTPLILPDGRRVMFADASMLDAADSRLMVQDLDGGEPRLVLESAADPRLLPSGRLAFMRAGTLMTIGFDVNDARAQGPANVALDGVMQSGLRQRLAAENTGAGMFAVSSEGALAFVPGTLVGSGDARLVWAESDGQTTPAEPRQGSPAGERFHIRIAPDGSRAVVQVPGPRKRETWLADWKRDAWTPCPECGGDSLAVWSPDGERLLLARNDTLFAHAINGAVPDEVIVREAGRRLVPSAWLEDGGVLYESSPDATRYEIKYTESRTAGGRVIVPLGAGVAPALSPDRHWLAYTSLQDGAREVIVQAFPGPGAREQISAGGGFNPAWSADGRTLYFLRDTEPRGSAMVASAIVTEPRLDGGRPRELFRRAEPEPCVAGRCYDVSRDGSRFLLREQSGVARPTVARFNLVLNWVGTLANTR